MNLSTLNGPELRQLLDTARARGQAELSYQILQEMEARREARGRGLFRMRRGAAEPRVLELGDPQEAEDDIPPMPLWVAPVREPPPAAVLEPKPKPKPKPVREPSPPPSRRRKAPPPAAAAAVPAPEVAPAAPPPSPTPEPPRPRSVWDAEPEPLPMPTRPARERKRPGLSRPPAVFAAGMAAGVVLGVGVAGMWREAPPPAPVPVAMQTAALTPRPAPVASAPVAAPVEPSPTPEVTDASAVEASPTESAPAPSPDAADYAQEAGPALELPREPEPAEEEAAVAEAPRDACAARPTPADRTICGDPELQRLQRQLRRAYAQALDAHEERDLLRQRQLAWRDARSAVSNPDRLATLYEDRIRRLNAATEAARRER